MEKRVRHGKFFKKWQIGLKQIKKARLDFPNRTAPFGNEWELLPTLFPFFDKCQLKRLFTD